MPKKIFITFDTDWCSDLVLEECVGFLSSLPVKITWFITHDSPVIKEKILKAPCFDVGPHPNFLQGSSHGENHEVVLEYASMLVPDFKLFRNHGCYYDGHLIKKIREKGALLDASLFMPNCLNAALFKQYVNSSDYILRVPYVWSDYYFLLKQEEHDPIKIITNSKNPVLCFHPIHLYFNSKDIKQYNSIKSGNLTEQLITDGKGVKDLFLEVVDYCHKNRIEMGLLKEFISEVQQ